MNQPIFTMGDKVKRMGFVDCHGEHSPEIPGLVVTDVKYIECTSIPSYYRIKAELIDGKGWVEGAERFFTAEEYRINVQGKDTKTGQVGSFVADAEANAISPVFSGLQDLYPWMRQNGWKSEEYPNNGPFIPWRVVRTA